ncbi:MAG: hypothetical protein LBL07_04785 [Tannerella sp.]|jgi:hypothetical protein|nr:hypothetical protein [Tannerella sp.]
MEKIKISLFDELYYWSYFYAFTITKPISIYKPPESNPRKNWGGLGVWLPLIVANSMSVWVFAEYILKSIGFIVDDREPLFSIFLFLWFGFIYIYYLLKVDSIVAKGDKLPRERRIRGKLKFWIYVIFTIVFYLCVGSYFKPLKA